jgi:hypothetical protein
MIIANRLSDGLVVFFAAADAWVTEIAEGAVIDDPAQAQQWLERAKRAEKECKIVDPNVIAVDVKDGRPRPTEIREAIRAFGPSAQVRTDRLAAE